MIEPAVGRGEASAPGNAYVAAISATGTRLFTCDIHQFALHGIASNGTIAAISALAAL